MLIPCVSASTLIKGWVLVTGLVTDALVQIKTILWILFAALYLGWLIEDQQAIRGGRGCRFIFPHLLCVFRKVRQRLILLLVLCLDRKIVPSWNKKARDQSKTYFNKIFSQSCTETPPPPPQQDYNLFFKKISAYHQRRYSWHHLKEAARAQQKIRGS